MTLLTADQILTADDLDTKDVEVSEWGGSVRVRGLSGRERDRFEASLRDDRGETDTDNIRAKLVGRAVIDETGSRVFTDAQINALGEKSGAVLDRLFDEIRDLSGMTDEAAEKIAGNSEAAPSDGSTSV